jgi:hypothetical protein
MTDTDRVKLLYGPYQAPPLKRGDKATCLFRDCTVVVTSWTSARIAWPRCRAIDSAGGSGLLVDEELARAVRNESAEAVKFWWGASPTAVGNWRRALGVGRTDNEGTRRLVQAAAEMGAEAVKDRDWSEEEREARRRQAVEMSLGANLILGYHGPRWTPEDVALLGVLTDDEVAQRTGRTPEAVRQKREELNIPNPAGGRRRWTQDEVALLGNMTDEEVAEKVGRPPSAVTQKRLKQGIKNSGRRRRGRR